MNFRMGQRVWIAWHPDHICGARAARCTVGTIVEGPFPAGVYASNHASGFSKHPDRNWIVKPDACAEIRADEGILYPIDDNREFDLDAILDEVSA